MSELLIEKNLRSSQAGDEIRIIARSRTLIALRELDADRKGSLLRFLYEARLINKDEKEGILNLTGADLSAAQLSGVDLSRAKLSGADLVVCLSPCDESGQRNVVTPLFLSSHLTRRVAAQQRW